MARTIIIHYGGTDYEAEETTPGSGNYEWTEEYEHVPLPVEDRLESQINRQTE